MGDDQLRRGRRKKRGYKALDRGVGLAKASREHLLCAELESRRQDRMFGVDRSGAKLLEYVRVGAEAHGGRVAKPSCH
jgi:hypothetical protein